MQRSRYATDLLTMGHSVSGGFVAQFMYTLLNCCLGGRIRPYEVFLMTLAATLGWPRHRT